MHLSKIVLSSEIQKIWICCFVEVDGLYSTIKMTGIDLSFFLKKRVKK